MANDSDGLGWLAKGCGCGCLGCGFLILVGVLLTFSFAPNVVEKTRSVFERESQISNWRGPDRDDIRDATSAAALLPLEVDGLERSDIEQGPGPEILGLDDQTLWQATYRDSARVVQVWVMATEEGDAEWFFDRANSAMNRNQINTRSTLDTGRVLSYTWGSPRQAAALWAPESWLFATHAENAADASGFIEALLTATDLGARGSATAKP